MSKARWIRMSEDFDYRWPSGSVTELCADTKVYVKGEVADAVIKAKAGEETKKPEDDDPEHVTSGAKMETDRTRDRSKAVKSNFSGYPDYAETRLARLRDREAVTVPEDRSEPVETTVADNETTARQLSDAEKQKASQNK